MDDATGTVLFGGVVVVILLVGAMMFAANRGGNDRVCLTSHTEVTPAGLYFEPRIKTGPGVSIGTGGGLGIGAPSGSNTIDYGPVIKAENRVTVCDEWGTPTPEE